MKEKRLEVDLPWPPRGLSPNGRLTVWAKARLFKSTKGASMILTHRAMVEQKITGVRLAKGSRMNLQLICTPPVNRYRDEDNLIANCKAVFDGVADALRIDDHLFHFKEQMWFPAEKPGKLIIRLDWEDIDE